ncbi:MAG: rhodanese-like domain-containing protein [Ghiorsea sp.]
MFKLWMVVLIGLLLTSCDSEPPQGSSLISVQGAHEVLTQGQRAEPFLFLDVRTPEEYKNGHVPGAKNVSVQVLLEHLAEIPKDRKLFVYCESGVRSTKATKILVDAGYTHVINMKASMRGWREANYPIEK